MWSVTLFQDLLTLSVSLLSTQGNTDDVINHIVNTIEYYLSLTPRKVAAARKAAVELALQAEWKNFFPYYRQAYAIALKKAAARQ